MAQHTGKQVEKWRVARNMTQRDLAKLLKISASMICRLETGRQIPTLRVAILIESTTGVPVTAWTTRRRAVKGACRIKHRSQDRNFLPS